MRIKVYDNVHYSGSSRSSSDGGVPYKSYIRGNSKIISMYGTGANINVVVNDSSTNPNMNDSDFTLTLPPEPASYGKLIFTRLYLPAAWYTGQLEVWVDGKDRKSVV